ncbi:RNA-binding protein nob1 [Anaeramoeba flamelloides]|uniref:RNA-binding protein nob1 n=1 Tax=Anaeramoeba flamelloides TaxID=1746091 RepID=A0AAV7ZG33_9EUKA|nr:RNA-binding protein nob1 [Anaeramoeba flamelloides]
MTETSEKVTKETSNKKTTITNEETKKQEIGTKKEQENINDNESKKESENKKQKESLNKKPRVVKIKTEEIKPTTTSSWATDLRKTFQNDENILEFEKQKKKEEEKKKKQEELEKLKKAHHIVIDAGALILGKRLDQISQNLYTIHEVEDEIKDETSRKLFETIRFLITFREPSKIALSAITNFSKKTGDFEGLSKTDLKVLALNYDLEKQYNGISHLKKEPVHSTKKKKKMNNNNFDGWITPKNINKAKKIEEEKKKVLRPGKKTRVSCATTDYAMQNVCLQMGMNVLSVDGFRIKKLKSWAKRCYACMEIVKDLNREFCPTCGSGGLLKIPYYVDDYGGIHYGHVPERFLSKRGKKYTLPKPQMGKKPLILREDQMPGFGRSKKSHNNKNKMDQDYLFFKSRKAKKKVQIGMGKRNPNIPKKRTSKKKKKQQTD